MIVPKQSIYVTLLSRSSLRLAETRYSTYLLTYGAEPFLRSCQLCSYSRTSQHFMEPMFTRALHWSLSSVKSIQSKAFLPVSLRPILIVSTHLRLGLSWPPPWSAGFVTVYFSGMRLLAPRPTQGLHLSGPYTLT
jgi:hypothetical protein